MLACLCNRACLPVFLGPVLGPLELDPYSCFAPLWLFLIALLILGDWVVVY